MFRRAALFLLLLALGSAAAWAEEPAATARLVADIRPAAGPPAGSAPHWLTPADDLLFFAADDGFSGVELWTATGAPAETRRVTDLCPGPCSSAPSYLTAAGELLFFVAHEPAHGAELWRSDGTAAGTLPLVDIVPGPAPGAYAGTQRGSFVAAGDRLFFIARRGSRHELWTSDGAPAGTTRLASFAAHEAPRLLGSVGSLLLFVGHDEEHGRELWTSDGTAAGTRLMADIRPGPEGGGIGEPDGSTAALDGRLFFGADDGVRGLELWTSDGTAEGTRLARDVAVGRAASYPQRLVAVADAVYFIALPHARHSELWLSDGTADGTRRVTAQFTYLSTATALGRRLVVTNVLPGRGIDLRITDGSDAGRLLRRFAQPSAGTTELFTPVRAGRFVFFQVLTGTLESTTIELWRTNGTPEGTQPIARLESGVWLVAFRGGVWFAGGRSGNSELWTSDGSAGGTRLFADLHAGDRSSLPHQLAGLGGLILFAADDGEHGRELWASDGTGAGTELVGDLAPPPPAGGTPAVLAEVGGRLLFATAEVSPELSVLDGSLWSTSGAPGDAQLLRRGVGVAHAGRALGGVALFFTTREEGAAVVLRLWRSDGTAAGTEPLAEVDRTWLDGPPFGGWVAAPEARDLAIAGGRLYFLARGVLWRSDGTAAGTAPVAGPCANPCPTFHDLAASGDTLFFGGLEGASERIREVLWRSDGTAAGTQPVRTMLEVPFDEWWARSGAPGIAGLTSSGGRLFFAGDDGLGGAELWMSDGTPAGTQRVRDLRPGPAGSHPSWLTPFGGGVFFAADGGPRGQELWWSDGTGRGTRLVRDIAPGGAPSYPQELSVVAGGLVFAAFDPAHGLEAWRSDGTAAGTVLLADVLPGRGSSAPRSFTLAGGTLFFVAGRPRLGYELWAIGGAGE